MSPRSAAARPREGVRGRGRQRRGDWRTKHLRACLLCRPGVAVLDDAGTCPVCHVDRSICLTCDQVFVVGVNYFAGLPPSRQRACRSAFVNATRPCCTVYVTAGRRCWSCPVGVPSRDGTAGLGRTVWSTTTNGKGRSVERQLECRGRLVWRTRRPWGRSVSVVAPSEPGGGALSRADHVRVGVDARPRANPPLRNAGQLAERCGRQRNAGTTASSPMSRTTQVSGKQWVSGAFKALPAVRTLFPAARMVTLPAPRRRPRPACDPRAQSADVRRCRTSSTPRSPVRPRTRRSARADTPLRTSATATAAR